MAENLKPRSRVITDGPDRAPPRRDRLAPLDRAISVITKRPAQPGNTVELLRNGDAAYPAMLDAITEARTSIALSIYIFSDDTAGAQFIAALIDAVEHGERLARCTAHARAGVALGQVARDDHRRIRGRGRRLQGVGH